MKKITALVLCFIFAMSLVSCSNAPNLNPPNETDDKVTYKLTVIDDHNLVYERPSGEKFEAGTILKFHAYVVCDADLDMYANGNFVSRQDAVEGDDGYIWEYTFEMPSQDTVIEFKIAGIKGF